MKSLLKVLLASMMLTLVACRSTEGESTKLQAVQLSIQGEQFRKQGDLQTALETQQTALQLVNANSDPGIAAVILNNLGLAYSGMGKYPEALRAFEEAVPLHRKVNDRKARLEEGSTLDNMGLVYQQLGQGSKALESHQAALAIFEKENSPADVGIALNNIGALYQKAGDFPKAVSTYQKALSIAQETNDLQSQFAVLNNLGVVYNSLKQPSKALETYQKGLEVAKASKNRLGEATTLLNIAALNKDTPEERSKALELSKQALTIAQQLGARSEQVTALVTIARISKLQNQTDQAISNYRQAIEIAESIRQELSQSNPGQAVSYTQTIGGAYTELAELLNQVGKPSEAQEVLGLLKK